MLSGRRGLVALTAGALLAGCGAWVALRPLPRWQRLDAAATVGAFHVHSSDSHDSEVPVETLAAAARAGALDFVVLTDHNAQRPRPARIAGVCVLSQAELSTASGHAVQLGVPYVPDATVRAGDNLAAAVAGSGGQLVLAHPSDPKRPWTGSTAAVVGIEVANTAAAARRVGGRLLLGLLPALASWPLNRPLVLAQFYRRDDAALALWDGAAAAPWMGICGSDTHGWIDVGLNMASWHVVLSEPWPAAGRAAALGARLKAGRFYCAAGLLGRAPSFTFVARGVADGAVARAGDSIAAAAVRTLEVAAPATSAGDSVLVLRRDGAAVQVARGARTELARPPAGTYRAEVYVPMPHLGPGVRWVPAIYSNRIRLLPAGT